MNICIPTIGNKGLDDMIYEHFGSSSFFTIYNSDTKSIQAAENSNMHHNHGACQPLSVISDYNIDIILTSDIGKRAVQLLNSSGIKVYKLDGNTVKEAIKKFESNELVELTAENACRGHNCH